MTKILMVCLGNICRSPLADGLLRQKAQDSNLEIEIDSCGTSGHHSGELPDERMMETASKYGYDLSHLRSRQIEVQDLDHFDVIYVMDSSNYNNVMAICSNDIQKNKVRFLLNENNPNSNMAVPDPYYGGSAGFENVFNLVDEATNVIIEKLKSNTLV